MDYEDLNYIVKVANKNLGWHGRITVVDKELYVQSRKTRHLLQLCDLHDVLVLERDELQKRVEDMTTAINKIDEA